MAQFRLARPAEIDLANILSTSAERWGAERAGDIGTVVERRVVPGVSEEGSSVEFFDMARSR